MLPTLLQLQHKCIAERFQQSRVLALKTSSLPLSVCTAPVQSDDSSGDEKLSFAPDELVKKNSHYLSSGRVVQPLCCLRRRPAIAFVYFRDTESIGFNHDLSTYSEIIQILSHARQRNMLVCLFCDLVSRTKTSNIDILPLIDHLRRSCTNSHALTFASDCLIKVYTNCHDRQTTTELFGHICRLGFVPSVWACNVLLKFVAESGESDMVVAAYDQMKCFHLTPDVHTLDIVTRSLFQAKTVDDAFQVWVEMTEMGVKLDTRAYSTFVFGLCNCGKYDLAYAVLQEINRGGVQFDAMTYNKVMKGLCTENRLEEAETVLENMTKQGYATDVYSYSYLIQSYCKMGNLLKALDHYEAMLSHGLETNCHIVSYLLQCFRKLGMTSEVIVHLQKFRESGVRLDGVLFNIAMNAYCELGNMDEAVMLLKEMKGAGLAPDKIHYTCLIDGYCRKEEIKNARQVFDETLRTNIKPDAVTYNTLAGGFCKSGLVVEAYDLIEHMMD
jgi:pentatricopeptide repeat protein